MNRSFHQAGAFWRYRGFSLIELMVGMLIGLIVLGGIVFVFLGNQTSSRHQQSLSLTQESGRLALEILARDMREAGFTGCGHGSFLVDAQSPSDPLDFAGVFDIVEGPPSAFTIQRAIAGSDLPRVTAWAGDTLTVSDASGFATGDSLILTDCVQGQILTVRSVAGNVVSVNDANNVTVANILVPWSGASSFMTALPIETVDYSLNVATNELLRGGQAIAGGVRNMAVTYGVDTSGARFNHEVTAYDPDPDPLDAIAMRIVFTVFDGDGDDEVELTFPTTMTMRNRVADRP